MIKLGNRQIKKINNVWTEFTDGIITKKYKVVDEFLITYDMSNRIVSEEHIKGVKSTYFYDDSKNSKKITKSNGEEFLYINDKLVMFQNYEYLIANKYNELGKILIEIKFYKLKSYSTRVIYEYRKNGVLYNIIEKDWKYEIDFRGNIKTKKTLSENLQFIYSYDKSNNITHRRILDRIATTELENGKEICYRINEEFNTYNEFGKIINRKNYISKRYKILFDKNGRIIQENYEIAPKVINLDFIYHNDLIIEEKIDGETVKKNYYDEQNKIIWEENIGYYALYFYNELGLLNSKKILENEKNYK
jgi:hypothetical protein